MPIPDDVKAQADAVINDKSLPTKAFGQPEPPNHDASQMPDPYDTKAQEAFRAQKRETAQQEKSQQIEPERG